MNSLRTLTYYIPVLKENVVAQPLLEFHSPLQSSWQWYLLCLDIASVGGWMGELSLTLEVGLW